MKTYLLIAALLVFAVIAGCNAPEPVGIAGQEITFETAQDTAGTPSGTLIKLPKSLLPIVSSIRVTKLVSPNSTTNFSGTLSYLSEKFGLTTFDVKFTIPPGAVTDTVTVSMRIDTSFALIEFKPDGLQFQTPAAIDVTLLNLEPFSRGQIIKFVYVTANGTLVPQEFDQLVLSGKKGNILLKKGRIHHFSAYSFGRLTSEENGH